MAELDPLSRLAGRTLAANIGLRAKLIANAGAGAYGAKREAIQTAEAEKHIRWAIAEALAEHGVVIDAQASEPTPAQIEGRAR